MILGIVGSEAAKFTRHTEAAARFKIRELLQSGTYTGACSGACHLGGVDIWAIEEATALGLPSREFPPRRRSWIGGYKDRNIKIATFADELVCLTVRELPAGYAGMRFPRCYHCGTTEHVKSGGCWTVKYAREVLGKPGTVIVIG